MIHAAFISRNDDWILPHKLRVLSEFCDRIFILLDRSPQSVEICARFPKVEVRHWTPTMESFPMARDGPTWDEGEMRQAVWDWATQDRPQWIVLGDSDEIPAPSIVPMIEDAKHRGIDCYYADWMNLIRDAGHAIGGTQSPWSYQAAGSNKKGMLIRYDPAKQYRYRLHAKRHCRMEPSPLHEARTLFDDTHQTGPTPLLHYRWANWHRWQHSDMAKLPAYQPWPPAESSIINVPRHLLWRWDADEYLRGLTGPVAVVGNGRCEWKGEEIDAHATIIRFNNFETRGFEEHVGARTTCWYSNCWDDVTPRPWTGDMITGYTDAEQGPRLSRWLGMYPHMHVPMGESWFDAARKVKPDSPSHGLALLARLAHHGKEVHAYGFDGMQTGHYFDAGHRHDHTPESSALKSLAVTFK